MKVVRTKKLNEGVMTRLEAIELQEKTFGKGTLMDLCINLHQALNGGSDPWPKENVIIALKILNCRIVEWLDGNSFDKRFDNAAKELIEATIEQAEFLSS